MPILGCTDSRAQNFLSVAQADNGACEIAGCTNPAASNYEAAANFDDGTCTFVAAARRPSPPYHPMPTPPLLTIP